MIIIVICIKEITTSADIIKALELIGVSEMTKQFETEDFSDIKAQPMEKLIKLRDRRKQNWMEMQKAASEEYRLMWEVEDEINKRLGLL